METLSKRDSLWLLFKDFACKTYRDKSFKIGERIEGFTEERFMRVKRVSVKDSC